MKEMVWTTIYGHKFENDFFLSNKELVEIRNKILELLKNELPEESRIYETYAWILQDCKEKLQLGKMDL
ncbi:hypothetical protein LQZ18_08395 [Lachnospiraceae bacterium ZAX-1]